MRPTDVDTWIELAGAYRGAGDGQGQRHALEQALKIQPTNSDVKTLLASSGPVPGPSQ
jgi:cytochrome c-type biogenesis protein CcmH/NrfG